MTGRYADTMSDGVRGSPTGGRSLRAVVDLACGRTQLLWASCTDNYFQVPVDRYPFGQYQVPTVPVQIGTNCPWLLRRGWTA